MKKHIKKALSVIALVILCLTITILPTFAYDYPTWSEPTGGFLSLTADIVIDDFTNDYYITDTTPVGYIDFSFQDLSATTYSAYIDYNAYQTLVAFDTSIYNNEDRYSTFVTFDNVYISNDGMGSTDAVNMAKRGIFMKGMGNLDVYGIVFVNGTKQEISLSAQITSATYGNVYAYITQYIAQTYYTNEWFGYFGIDVYYEDGGIIALPLLTQPSEYVHDAMIEEMTPTVDVFIQDVPIGEFLWESINGFLSTEIFGSVTFYHLLSVIIIIPLLTWILKLLAGG